MTEWKNSPQKKEQEAVLTARDLINMDISKISELKFKITILKILAEVEKNRRYFCGNKETIIRSK